MSRGDRLLLPPLLLVLGMWLPACKSVPLWPDQAQLLDMMSTPALPRQSAEQRDPEPGPGSVEHSYTSKAGGPGNAPDGPGETDYLANDHGEETGDPGLPPSEILSPADLSIGPNGVPAIPLPEHVQPLIVDENRIFATVNGEVVSSRDVRQGIESYIDNIEAVRYGTGTVASGTKIDMRGWYELQQTYRRKALLLLYSQEAQSLRRLGIGSISREDLERAMNRVREQHGVRGNSSEDAEKWSRILARLNMTHFDFEQYMRERLEADRVQHLYAFHPEMRLGVSFDVSPEEMRREYARNPIRATTDIVIHIARFPLLAETYDQREASEQTARQFMEELESAFAAVGHTTGTAGVEANRARRAAFVDLASKYSAGFIAEPENRDNLHDEQPEFAAEIRRTRAGHASRLILIPREEIAVIFVVSKKQAGLEPFTSPAVQKELARRLLNQRWNDFRGMVDRELIRKASVISPEAGGLSE